ncbi:hypothetical protein ANN_02251 [Periplaneta americana]|uniref:Uncharacterized protein n=1 Tax=Periplaneta americana TaxID=6978 RepID=A0ABQ8TVS2_PERAM|nr:hypothetical protein ANN_02251 [Periplaneta americana]
MVLSSEDAARAVALIADGHSFHYVANVLRTSPTSIFRVVKLYSEHNSFHRRPGSGCSRSTSARDIFNYGSIERSSCDSSRNKKSVASS